MDKRITVIGCLLIVFLAGGLFAYQKYMDGRQVEPFYMTENMDRMETLEGYEEPELLVCYMICQIQRGDLDLALRGCAIENLAEYFVLESYLELTDEFRGIENLPPSETESEAYMGISSARLAGDYAEMLEQCRQLFGSEHEVQLLSVSEYIPENPDGMYYQTRQKLCEALGCRSVSEMQILLRIDGEDKEMYWTLVRYRSRWNVLAFNELDSAGQKEIVIRSADISSVENLSFDTEDVLPLNYSLVNQNKEDTPEALLENFFLYLQREDIWSAMSYFYLYDTEGNIDADQDLLARQGELAQQIQMFYYQLFIPNRNIYEWYQREPAERGGDLVEALMCDQVVSLNLDYMQQISETADDKADYRAVYSYNGYTYVLNFTLVNQNGWMIESMDWQEETWLY